jgi:hypothetical protein
MSNTFIAVLTIMCERIYEHLQHLPVELVQEAVRRHREHKEGERAAEMTGRQPIDALTSFMIMARLRTFLAAVANGEYDKALSCCAPGLQKALEQEGAAAKFDGVRAHLADVVEVGSISLAFSETSWHLTGVITYEEDRKANFSLDFGAHLDLWMIVGYKFDPVPIRALTERSASESDELKKGAGSGKGWVSPVDDYTCPDGYPIKGSGKYIYHMPGGRFYDRTRPIRCFATIAEAEAAGFSASRR